ncbi:MAG: hypothetical protein J4432_04975 [DPANN group archaeon]|nr:hypothetical protein [DPANN group archaeon]
MNIAAGTELETGKQIGSFDAKSYITRLMADSFSGYLCATVEEKHGFEEGILLFNAGQLTLAEYEYFHFSRVYKGKEALDRALNALTANSGIMDTYSLTSQETQLAMSLNAESIIPQIITVRDFKMPQAFSRTYEEQLLEQKQEEFGKQQLLKKMGITKRREVTNEQLLDKSRDEQKEEIEMSEAAETDESGAMQDDESES